MTIKNNMQGFFLFYSPIINKRSFTVSNEVVEISRKQLHVISRFLRKKNRFHEKFKQLCSDQIALYKKNMNSLSTEKIFRENKTTIE